MDPSKSQGVHQEENFQIVWQKIVNLIIFSEKKQWARQYSSFFQEKIVQGNLYFVVS